MADQAECVGCLSGARHADQRLCVRYWPCSERAHPAGLFSRPAFRGLLEVVDYPKPRDRCVCSGTTRKHFECCAATVQAGQKTRCAYSSIEQIVPQALHRPKREQTVLTELPP